MDSTVTATIARVGLDAAPSPLSLRLDTRDDALRAFQRAREAFIAGNRISMGELASELGVDRTSLFRWVGNRDDLLSEVLWSLAVPTFVQAEQHGAGLTGAERLVAILTEFVDGLIHASYCRTFLRREPARALRLLTTKHSPIQRRFLATVEWLVRAELGDTPLGGVIDPAGLAYLLSRVSESFSYADLISGDEPSVERARVAFQLVLRVDG